MLGESSLNRIIAEEITWKTSRSGGKGGQNVNKVESKVELIFDVNNSKVLNSNEKEIIIKACHALRNGSEIHITSQKHRSQLDNKEECIRKLEAKLKAAFVKKKKRVKTKPSKATKETRLKKKRLHSEKKQSRQFKSFD